MGSIFQSCVSDHVGHLSADAIAANSVSSTFFQYLKVIVIAISSASAVVIGKDIGEGDIERVKSDGRTLSVIDVLIGIVLASLLFVLRGPLLSMYKLTDTAAVLANHFIMIMSVVMVGMSYQMPVSVGVIQGGGDTRFSIFLRHLYGNFRWNWLWLQCSQINCSRGFRYFYGLGAISGFTN